MFPRRDVSIARPVSYGGPQTATHKVKLPAPVHRVSDTRLLGNEVIKRQVALNRNLMTKEARDLHTQPFVRSFGVIVFGQL